MDTIAATSDAPLFGNAEWVVTQDSLEHRQTGYALGLDGLDERRPDGTWFWPVHMLDKRWCEPRAFADAFAAALKLRGIPVDGGLAASFRAPDGTVMLDLVPVAGGAPPRKTRPSRAGAVRLDSLTARITGTGHPATLRRAG